ncbi:hypothetical protein [Undibacterium sp. Ren11W]|uniref:hypothetical protein n=1 Tax=Undibacterium sp. Ren11W TaxID=3413045 RepID=UPI003BF437AD
MRLSFAIIITALLAACGKNEVPPIKIAEPQRQQLQKAKEVDQLLQKAAESQRLAIDAATASQAAEK